MAIVIQASLLGMPCSIPAAVAVVTQVMSDPVVVVATSVAQCTSVLAASGTSEQPTQGSRGGGPVEDMNGGMVVVKTHMTTSAMVVVEVTSRVALGGTIMVARPRLHRQAEGLRVGGAPTQLNRQHMRVQGGAGLTGVTRLVVAVGMGDLRHINNWGHAVKWFLFRRMD